jgi:hypothetical protein
MKSRAVFIQPVERLGGKQRPKLGDAEHMGETQMLQTGQGAVETRALRAPEMRACLTMARHPTPARVPKWACDNAFPARRRRNGPADRPKKFYFVT